MADQGPLVRVDVDGRRNLIKMTRKAAEQYVAAHPGASIVGVPRAVPVPPGLSVAPGLAEEKPAPPPHARDEEASGEPPAKPIEKMNKAGLKAFALALGLRDEGTNAELIERIKAVPVGEPAAEATSEETPAEDGASEE